MPHINSRFIPLILKSDYMDYFICDMSTLASTTGIENSG
jgi:hypothetical protein